MRVLISGGGTGGHIFPALSIAGAIRRREPDAEILFVGAEGRMEMERVPAAGYEIVGLPVSGFDRRRLWRNFRVLWRLWRSMRKARKLVRDFKPDIAVGVGGYASGPTLKAAQKAGVATLLQEQNSYPGVTNKMLAGGAGSICVAYPGLERFFPAEKIVMTGNPVRANLLECTLTKAEAKKALGFDPEKPLLLVVGGSLGARTINQAVIDNALDGSVARGGYQLLWQTGKSDGERCAAIAAERKAEGVKATMFISEMDTAYRAADLVVARAGAGTISELELLGLPTILVPSPNVAEDHQRKNAEALSSRGAAVLVPDKDASTQLWPEVERLMADPAAREELSANILKLAEKQSAERIVDEIYRLASRKDK